jgi:hypothetical protein
MKSKRSIVFTAQSRKDSGIERARNQSNPSHSNRIAVSSPQSSPAGNQSIRLANPRTRGMGSRGVAIPINPQLGCAPANPIGIKPRGESLAGTAVQVRGRKKKKGKKRSWKKLPPPDSKNSKGKLQVEKKNGEKFGDQSETNLGGGTD